MCLRIVSLYLLPVCVTRPVAMPGTTVRVPHHGLPYGVIRAVVSEHWCEGCAFFS